MNILFALVVSDDSFKPQFCTCHDNSYAVLCEKYDFVALFGTMNLHVFAQDLGLESKSLL